MDSGIKYMNGNYRKYEVSPEELRFHAPDAGELGFLRNMEEKPSVKPYVISIILAAVIILAVIFFKAPFYFLAALIIPLVFVIYNASQQGRKNDYGVFYGTIAAKRSVRHGRSKTLYVAVWSEQEGQFCDRIEYIENSENEFRHINPGDKVIVFRAGDRIFAHLPV